MSRYIDADALKSKLEGVLKDCAGTGLFSIDSLILIADTLQMIETEPTANVQEVKHGKADEETINQNIMQCDSVKVMKLLERWEGLK